MPHSQVLRDMALFVEVARRRSFTAASAALGMPVSSLSRRIAAFEAMAGARLIERTTRKLSLTPYGQAYYDQATRIVEDAQKSFDELVAQAKGPSGTLRLAVPPDAWIVGALAKLLDEYSGDNGQVVLHVEQRPAPVDLTDGLLDLAVVIEEPADSSLISRRVAEVATGLFAAPSYLDGVGRPDVPADLEGCRAIHTGAGADPRWLLFRDCESATVELRASVSCRGGDMARQLAVAGHGIVGACHACVEADVEAGRLEQVLPDWRLPPTSVYVLTTSRLLTARARSFVDHAARRLAPIIAPRRGANVVEMRAAGGLRP